MESTVQIKGKKYQCEVSRYEYLHGKGANILLFDNKNQIYMEAKVLADRASDDYARFECMGESEFLQEALQIYQSRVTQEQIESSIQSGIEVLYGI
ncbi:MAG: hypothetical protein K1563_17425 [Candidatus Thiodiazotropha sp. (ex. Lucinisca nassula)]|nr:hypothetical protein [Candidatus Thiodiazotropha sp. (ex. Lucinisca nassula)]MBW9275462.1 hypothetical protein [Candidatus Thiodiazotropha sp. (ex. Lucinisca nassula)]